MILARPLSCSATASSSRSRGRGSILQHDQGQLGVGPRFGRQLLAQDDATATARSSQDTFIDEEIGDDQGLVDRTARVATNVEDQTDEPALAGLVAQRRQLLFDPLADASTKGMNDDDPDGVAITLDELARDQAGVVGPAQLDVEVLGPLAAIDGQVDPLNPTRR